MANQFYTPFFEGLMKGEFGDLESATIRAIFVNAEGDGTVTYTFSASHSTLADIDATNRGADVATLTNVVVTGSQLDADPLVFNNVAALATPDKDFDALVLYIELGALDTEKRLLMYIDTGVGITNGTLTPSGGTITVNWDTGANAVFAL